ncbi:RICIN domain-containing protein [Actinomadura montaniterrae]|uniref:Ricin B lectin domain-containing protein n=1 Tax=Actinomadura montaniterrae TaxID=1803903 RepID=A0A6L3VKY9_9ACTN|nr:RICIN domain-containing protein [Actinomadura montaniterrae]KAB2371853.1 hypothetical protein F9B16_31110 [Actinomadura montaniterrae]
MPSPPDRRAALAALAALLASLGLLAGEASATVTRGAPLTAASELTAYTRLVRLEHADATHQGRILASTNNRKNDTISTWESTDDGASFHLLATLTPPTVGDQWAGSSTLFEFPRQLGASPAGTLILATAINADGGGANNPDPDTKIIAWKSADYGATWTRVAAPIVQGTTGHGVWEPEFSVTAAGALVVHFSDKTQQPAYGQTLARRMSSDGGETWGPTVNTVAISEPTVPLDDKASPGMPVVRQLPNGTFLMAYEYCNISAVSNGTGKSCRIYTRTSPDGWDWGDVNDEGTLVSTADGKQLSHSPTIAWAPGGGPNGRILLVARLVARPAAGDSTPDDGPLETLRPETGSTIFANTSNGVGAWYELDSPVTITGFDDTDARYTTCQNYSSPLLPSSDGSRVLQMSTDFDGTNCRAYFATGSTYGSLDAAGVSTSATYELINLKSRKCLTAQGNATADGTKVLRQPCDDTRLAQEFRAVSRGGGYFSFTKAGSSPAACMDIPNGNISADPGKLIQLWQCNTTTAQNWKPVRVGRNAYMLKAQKDENMCLEIRDGVLTDGEQARIYNCNGLAPQIWYLRQRL